MQIKQLSENTSALTMQKTVCEIGTWNRGPGCKNSGEPFWKSASSELKEVMKSELWSCTMERRSWGMCRWACKARSSIIALGGAKMLVALLVRCSEFRLPMQTHPLQTRIFRSDQAIRFLRDEIVLACDFLEVKTSQTKNPYLQLWPLW